MLCHNCKHWIECAYAAIIEEKTLLKDLAEMLAKHMKGFVPEGIPEVSCEITWCPSFKPVEPEIQHFKEHFKENTLN